MSKITVGVLGARSLIGPYLISYLQKSGVEVICYTRQPVEEIEDRFNFNSPGFVPVLWEPLSKLRERNLSEVISLVPIWELKNYFHSIEKTNPHRIIVLSSTSRFSKLSSSDESERVLVSNLIEGETAVQIWAESKKIPWTILRPTLIYDFKTDRSLCEIKNFIGKFGFFPVFGGALGRRQPVHADDVATAIVSALQNANSFNKAYTVSGAEILTYTEMVERIFKALSKKPRFMRIPLWAFGSMVAIARILPRYRKWTRAMAERMNMDLVFDYAEASRDFGFSPRKFSLED